jgi:hypothetical protein
MSTHTGNHQKEGAKKPKQLNYSELMENLRKRLRSKNLLSESNPPTSPPKETIIEVTFIKRTKN